MRQACPGWAHSPRPHYEVVHVGRTRGCAAASRRSPPVCRVYGCRGNAPLNILHLRIATYKPVDDGGKSSPPRRVRALATGTEATAGGPCRDRATSVRTTWVMASTSSGSITPSEPRGARLELPPGGSRGKVGKVQPTRVGDGLSVRDTRAGRLPPKRMPAPGWRLSVLLRIEGAPAGGRTPLGPTGKTWGRNKDQRRGSPASPSL